MENLLHTLSLSKNTNVVQKNQEKLKELPLAEWVEKMGNLRIECEVMDVDSLLEFVERFKQFYEEEELLVQDPRDEYKLVQLALKDMKNPPNTL